MTTLDANQICLTQWHQNPWCMQTLNLSLNAVKLNTVDTNGERLQYRSVQKHKSLCVGFDKDTVRDFWPPHLTQHCCRMLQRRFCISITMDRQHLVPCEFPYCSCAWSSYVLKCWFHFQCIPTEVLGSFKFHFHFLDFHYTFRWYYVLCWSNARGKARIRTI